MLGCQKRTPALGSVFVISWLRYIAVASVIVASTIPPVACSSDRKSPPPAASTTATDPAASSLLRSSAEATKKLTSSHVVIDFKGNFDRLGRASRVDADAQVPPLVANGQITYQGGQIGPFVLANDTVSVQAGNVWNEAGSTASLIPPQLINPSQGLPTILAGVVSPQSAGDEVIDGVATVKMTGILPADKAKDIVPEADGPADFTAWIRKLGDPVLVRTQIGLSSDKVITVTLSNWDVPVHVTSAPST